MGAIAYVIRFLFACQPCLCKMEAVHGIPPISVPNTIFKCACSAFLNETSCVCARARSRFPTDVSAGGPILVIRGKRRAIAFQRLLAGLSQPFFTTDKLHSFSKLYFGGEKACCCDDACERVERVANVLVKKRMRVAICRDICAICTSLISKLCSMESQPPSSALCNPIPLYA